MEHKTANAGQIEAILTADVRRRLIRIAAVTLGSHRELAEDVVHDAIVKILQKGMPDSLTSPVAWLTVVVKNEARDQRRPRRHTDVPLDDAAAVCSSSCDPTVRFAVESAISLIRIKAPTEATVLQMKMAGSDDRAIAASIGTAIATVRVHLSHGRKKLSKTLGLRGTDSPVSHPRRAA